LQAGKRGVLEATTEGEYLSFPEFEVLSPNTPLAAVWRYAIWCLTLITTNKWQQENQDLKIPTYNSEPPQ